MLRSNRESIAIQAAATEQAAGKRKHVEGNNQANAGAKKTKDDKEVSELAPLVDISKVGTVTPICGNGNCASASKEELSNTEKKACKKGLIPACADHSIPDSQQETGEWKHDEDSNHATAGAKMAKEDKEVLEPAAIVAISKIGTVIPTLGNGNCGYYALMLGLVNLNICPFSSNTSMRRHCRKSSQ